MSGLVKFSLEELADLDGGRAMLAFQQCVRTAVRDCTDRPGVKTKRTVLMKMEIVPVPSINGNTIDCDGCKATFKSTCSIPNFETPEVDFGVKHNGDLVFNPDSPRNHRQETFEEVRGTDD